MQPNVSELLEKINRIAQKPGFPNVSAIEKDLVKHYLRQLYDVLEHPAAQHTAPPVVKTETPVETQTQHRQPEELLAAVTPPVVKTEPATAEVQPVATITTTTVQHEVIATPATGMKIAEALHERIKGNPVEMHRKFAMKPMREMIDLNRKFVFVNELFKGDANAMAQAVAQVDELADYDSALQYVRQSLITAYGWDEASQAAKLFVKLVKQRFGEE